MLVKCVIILHTCVRVGKKKICDHESIKIKTYTKSENRTIFLNNLY